MASDAARDVYGDYNDLLRAGRSDEEAERQVIEMHLKECESTGETCIFWMALAKAEWEKGRLSELVKERALHWIDSGGDLELWEDPKKRARRSDALNQLKEALLGEMPPRRKLRGDRHLHSPWRKGDLLCVRICEDLRENPYAGKYGLAYVTDVGRWHLNRFESDESGYNEVVYLDILNWAGDEPPGERVRLGDLHSIVYEVHSSKHHGPRYTAVELTLYPDDRRLLETLCGKDIIAVEADGGAPLHRQLDGGESCQWITLGALPSAMGCALKNHFVEKGNWNPPTGE